MLQQIMTYASMISMALLGLLWIQSNFVSAADYTQQQYREVNNEVLYLEDRRSRLQKEEPPKELTYEDERSLERKREERSLLKQQIKN